MNTPLDGGNLSRRGFLRGMAGILAAGVAPAAIGSGILMPVRQIWTPTTYTFEGVDIARPADDGTYYVAFRNGFFRFSKDGWQELSQQMRASAWNEVIDLKNLNSKVFVR